jgi:hypothetical protein
MGRNLYTNTSKASAVIGLVVTTLALAYVSTNSKEIVEGSWALCKKGVGRIESLFHRGKKKYHILIKNEWGQMIDSGETIWR